MTANLPWRSLVLGLQAFGLQAVGFQIPGFEVWMVLRVEFAIAMPTAQLPRNARSRAPLYIQ